MSEEQNDFRRKSNRYKGYDYSCGGVYFITLCTNGHKQIFGKINATMHPAMNLPQSAEFIPNDTGRMVENFLVDIPQHYTGVSIEKYCIMPDHIHILFVINDKDDNRKSISRIIATFKSITAKQYKTMTGEDNILWQKSFYDAIIINGEQFDNAVNYIIDNPINWALNKDEEFRK